MKFSKIYSLTIKNILTIILLLVLKFKQNNSGASMVF